MKIVVTGGGGFVGSALVRDLIATGKRDDEIYLIDNLQRHGQNKNLDDVLSNRQVRLIQADLTSTDFYAKMPKDVERLYHLAAIVGVETTMQNPAKVLKVNTLSTLNVFDWFMEHAAKQARLLFSSSSEVYSGAEAFQGALPIPTPEDVPYVIPEPENPRFSYALSKMWGEAYGRYLSEASGKLIATVRYHNVYGPNMGFAHVIPQVVRRVVKRENPFKIIAEEQTRSFCWVNDAARLTRLVMESQNLKPGMVVHIGNAAEEVKIGDLYKMIFEHCQWNPHDIEKAPAPPGSVSRRCPDISTLNRVVRWDKFTPLKEGLAQTVSWYKENLNGNR